MKLQIKLYKLLYLIFILFILYIILLPNYSFSAYPNLITTLSNAFTKINTYLKKLGAPAAATAIGTGIFIKKFSFGDEERIRVGKKLIKTALFSYAFLLCTDLILITINIILS